jgi:hypothetical protein
MESKERMTKQGIRDLNPYGPRPGKAGAGAPAPANDVVEEPSPPLPVPVPDALAPMPGASPAVELQR